MKLLDSINDVTNLKVNPDRFFSATHEEIKSGATTDIYFINTRDVLRSANLLDTPVTAEIFTRTTGMFAGLSEVLELLKDAPVKIEELPEGEYFSPKEVVMRIKG
ncbi:MAG: nicotinate phosphoribosyltransferase, partial [Synergistaceae bacterium]|nr:nicotinate phosphoribosyltransferase [Synergistaceae bacterium]